MAIPDGTSGEVSEEECQLLATLKPAFRCAVKFKDIGRGEPDLGLHNLGRGYGTDYRKYVYYLNRNLNLYQFNLSKIIEESKSVSSGRREPPPVMDGVVFQPRVEDFFVDDRKQIVYILRSSGDIQKFDQESSHPLLSIFGPDDRYHGARRRHEV